MKSQCENFPIVGGILCTLILSCGKEAPSPQPRPIIPPAVDSVWSVLFADGLLIINEFRDNWASDSILHKGIVKTYPEWEKGGYSRDWAGEVERIDSVRFGIKTCPTRMNRTFSGCTALLSADLDSLDTSICTEMRGTFFDCRSLTELKLDSFETAHLAKADSMFAMCSALKRIYVTEKFVKSRLVSSRDMFYGCTKLTGANGTAYNKQYVDATYARLDLTGTPGYFCEYNGPIPVDHRNWNIEVGDYSKPFGEEETF